MLGASTCTWRAPYWCSVVPIVTAQLRRTGDPVAAPVSRVVLVLLGSSCCSGSELPGSILIALDSGEQLTVIALPVAHRLVGSLILAATVILAVRVAASRRMAAPGPLASLAGPALGSPASGPRGHDPDRSDRRRGRA